MKWASCKSSKAGGEGRTLGTKNWNAEKTPVNGVVSCQKSENFMGGRERPVPGGGKRDSRRTGTAAEATTKTKKTGVLQKKIRPNSQRGGQRVNNWWLSIHKKPVTSGNAGAFAAQGEKKDP